MGGVTRLARFFAVAVLATLALASGSAGAGTGSVTPNASNLVDCNGWSHAYKSAKPSMRGLCADPFVNLNGPTNHRAYDNSWYIGHDEPSVKFISGASGSGNQMTYLMQLGVDPQKKPTANGQVTHYGELSIAPWFGLPICDPKSYPMNSCTPDSNTNTGLGATTDAGSAFMELQFYPPGFGPFTEAFSCDQTRYCAALTIDSLECTYGFTTCNPNCFEPVNFAYVQRDGVPTGPPNPQQSDESTLSPNAQTLYMNGGDALKVSIQDTSDGLKAVVDDLTTGQSGYMVASTANGFMNTDPVTCDGTPFAFHAEYDTASQQNQVPWAALEGGVLMQQEIGHFESCNSVANPIGFIPSDPAASYNCVGGLDRKAGGEGPCGFTGAVFGCTGSTTEGGKPCAVPDFTGLCEYSDAVCVPEGPRPVSVSGSTETWSWPVAGCNQDVFQNGDLDFDGNAYRHEWPNGSPNHPTSFKYAGPLDAQGNPYPSVQFETDVGGSENDCDTLSGIGCTAPPHKASFYPFWSIGRQGSSFGTATAKACLWNFGDRTPGITSEDFNGDAQYGVPDVVRYGGTLTSTVMPNPQLTSKCRA
jgi:hypothetical protein